MPRSLRSTLSTISAIAAVGLALTSSKEAVAAPDVPSASPSAKVEQRVGVTDFSVEYASPGVKGRKIWGALVPFDEVWRAGANASTILRASRDFTFGDVAVPAGSYSVFAIPGKKSWTMVLNSKTDTWGTNGYDEANDVARVSVKPMEMKEPRERLTFLFSSATDDSVALDLEWERLRIRVPIQVDTKAHVLASIEKSVDAAWRPHVVSATWLMDNGGDLDRALGYAETSISIKPTWRNQWVKAQILGKKGDKAEAVNAATEAMSLGKGDYIFDTFYAESVAKAIEGWK